MDEARVFGPALVKEEAADEFVGGIMQMQLSAASHAGDRLKNGQQIEVLQVPGQIERINVQVRLGGGLMQAPGQVAAEVGAQFGDFFQQALEGQLFDLQKLHGFAGADRGQPRIVRQDAEIAEEIALSHEADRA